MAISAKTGTTSQAMTTAPWIEAAPFRPINCSVERFVSSSAPATWIHGSFRPARK
ncbi:MAG: hypothetical protein RLZZ221_2096 [Verrucomicrobiota bacterium]